MRKLFYIALFSFAITANATEKKGIIANTVNEKEVVIEYSNEINTEKEISENDMFFGCGSDGNAMYNEYIAAGMSHREARSARRAYVRDCRGNGPDGWLSILIFWA